MTPKTPTPDYGHKYADKQLAVLIKRLKISYMSASIELQGKILRYLEQFEKEDTAKRALFDSGELSHEDYMAWRSRVIAGTKQWVRMREQLAINMRQQNEIAAAMINDSLPDIYALNHNYGTYEAEVGSGIDTTYTLYDKSTVTRLLKEKQDLLPSPSVNIPKDERWNQQHLQSMVLRGILTGNSMQGIAAQFQEVTNMTANAAIRNARTAVTGAENAGRADSYKRAQSMGIKMKQVWIATLDDRTRDSHAMMDGEQVEVGKKFSNGCRYPGDPQGSPEEVFNCRCTVAAVVEGSDAYAGAARPSQYLQDSGMSYDRWRELHGERFYEKLFGSETEHGIINSESEAELSRPKPGPDEYAVVSDVIGTETYERKFHNLGESKKVANVMIFQARKTLWRRNGTPFEDLIYVNSETGKCVEQRSQDTEGRVTPTNKMINMVLGNPRRIIAMHNHPHNMLPSKSDLKNSKYYKFGVVLCHNGSVIKYSVTDNADINRADRTLSYMQDKLDAGDDLSEDIKSLANMGVQIEVIQ